MDVNLSEWVVAGVAAGVKAFFAVTVFIACLSVGLLLVEGIVELFEDIGGKD